MMPHDAINSVITVRITILLHFSLDFLYKNISIKKESSFEILIRFFRKKVTKTLKKWEKNAIYLKFTLPVL